MKTKRKVLLLTLCAVLLVAASVFGTIAYLTDTEAVTNVFTVGKVGLQLDEADVKPDGTLDTKYRVKENTYHLLPGHTYIKDPTVTVDAGSESSYIRLMVKVENLDKLKLAMPATDFPTFYNGELFLLQNLCVDKDNKLTWDGSIWEYETFHAKGTYAGCYEFRYHTTVDGKNGAGEDVAEKLEALFTNITVPGKVNNTQLEYLKDVKIVVTAHAMQADGFADADAAWNAFN